MPIPALQQEEQPARPLLRLVSSYPGVMPAQKSFLLFPRIFAHAVDACVLGGFSLYCAKIFSVLLISLHGSAINSTGKVAASVFRHAFAYSSTQLFAASFAALSVLYFVGLPLIFAGRTPGQALLGLRTVSDDGFAPPTLRQLALRLGGIAFTYAALGLPCAIGLRKRDGRFLHDTVSGSRVIKA